MNVKREHRTAAAKFEFSGLEIADRLDRAYFAAHPDTIRRGTVVPKKVPCFFPKLHIREVAVRRIAPGILIKAFINSHGNLVALVPDFDFELLCTIEGRKQAASCIKVLNSIVSAFVGSKRARDRG